MLPTFIACFFLTYRMNNDFNHAKVLGGGVRYIFFINTLRLRIMRFRLAAAVVLLMFAAVLRIDARPSCIGEFETCPGSGDCVLISSLCGSCATGQYLCPPSASHPSPLCVDDFAACQPHVVGTFWDTSLTVEVRLQLLAEATNLTEQIAQLTNRAPAIPRLYVPAYQWLNDDLHGLRGNWTTSLPNGCALGATWAKDTLHAVGRIIAREARAVHHYWTTRGVRGDDSFFSINGIGLTAYAPNINLVRDPRWGRAQEVYGEDPRLTGALAEDYVRGMQHAASETSDFYLSAAACCKHFAAYDLESFPIARYFYSAQVDGRDLFESYLPAFESCAARAGAAHVMCSYNSINGVPTCAEPRLLNDVLRHKWNYTGFVVSDYDAWNMIMSTHHYCGNLTCAAAVGINAGMDQEGGGDSAIDQMQQAVDMGLVMPGRVTESFKRLFRTRLELGMFDPPSQVPLANLSAATVASTGHVEVALKAGDDAICMYRNERQVLPLTWMQDAPSSASKRLLVVGPKAAATRWLLGNYDTKPVAGVVSVLEGVMNYACAPSKADWTMWWLLNTDLTDPNVDYPGTLAEDALACQLACNADVACNYFTWFASTGLCFRLPSDRHQRVGGMNRRQHSQVVSGPRFGLVISSANTDFASVVDDSVIATDVRECSQRCRALRDCRRFSFVELTGLCFLVMSNTGSARYAPGVTSGPSPMKCDDSMHNVSVAFVAACADGLSCTEPFGFSEAVREAQTADAVLLVLGLDQDMESEGHDRKSIALPLPQYELIDLMHDAVRSAGRGAPLVGLLVHGGTVAITPASFDALLDAWYPGMQGGSSIARVLFGQVNPAGRTPATFYAGDSDLPPNLAQGSFYPNATSGYKGLTYRYFQGVPSIPFGFGLSYTNYSYSGFRTIGGDQAFAPCDVVNIEVNVTNVGAVVGDEVVQLYVKQTAASVPVPSVRLGDFQRVRHIAPGETRRVTLSLEPGFHSVVLPDAQNIYNSTVEVEAGSIELWVGGGQPDYFPGALQLVVVITSTAVCGAFD